MRMTSAQFQRRVTGQAGGRARRARSNASNTGMGFQAEIEKVLAVYARLGIAKAHRATPPCKIVGSGQKVKVIFEKNPFLDFIGVIRHPQKGFYLPLQFEAKSTKTGSLPMGKKSGLTENQITSMHAWQSVGVVVGLLWHCESENAVAWIGADCILGLHGDGAKSLKFWMFDEELVAPGRGVRYDFAKMAVDG
jgi:penicillin-binding protein-related factor A (putative recombinase)